MATLTDRDITAYHGPNTSPRSWLINPYNPAQQNPASYDVRLGPVILKECLPYEEEGIDGPKDFYTAPKVALRAAIEAAARRGGQRLQDRFRWERVNIEERGGYWLAPGQFILGSTVEYISVPTTMECIFQLKSSPARAGLNHLLAAYIDPGYRGHITLELYNTSKHYYLRLEPNMLIGQLRFTLLASECLQSYSSTGHYNGDVEPQPSRVPYEIKYSTSWSHEAGNGPNLED